MDIVGDVINIFEKEGKPPFNYHNALTSKLGHTAFIREFIPLTPSDSICKVAIPDLDVEVHVEYPSLNAVVKHLPEELKIINIDKLEGDFAEDLYITFGAEGGYIVINKMGFGYFPKEYYKEIASKIKLIELPIETIFDKIGQVIIVKRMTILGTSYEVIVPARDGMKHLTSLQEPPPGKPVISESDFYEIAKREAINAILLNLPKWSSGGFVVGENEEFWEVVPIVGTKNSDFYYYKKSWKKRMVKKPYPLKMKNSVVLKDETLKKGKILKDEAHVLLRVYE